MQGISLRFSCKIVPFFLLLLGRYHVFHSVALHMPKLRNIFEKVVSDGEWGKVGERVAFALRNT